MLVHWNNSPRVDKAPNSVTLSWFWANKSFLLLLDTADITEKLQMQILWGPYHHQRCKFESRSGEVY